MLFCKIREIVLAREPEKPLKDFPLGRLTLYTLFSGKIPDEIESVNITGLDDYLNNIYSPMAVSNMNVDFDEVLVKDLF